MSDQKINYQQIANTGGTLGQALVVDSTGVVWGDVRSVATVYTAGTLLTGENAYVARWYPSRNITINNTRAWVITPGSQDVNISIRKNNITQLSMNISSTNVASNTNTITATENDYFTVIVNRDGMYARDLYVAFNILNT